MKGEPDESFKWYKDKEGLEDKRFPAPSAYRWPLSQRKL